MRRAKIMCTLGPSSHSEEIIEKLILSGMNLARFNFSHGDYDFYKSLIKKIRKISLKLSIPIGIMQDLQGPKVRTGKMKNGKIFLEADGLTNITSNEIFGTNEIFSCQYKQLPKDIKPGEIILIDDGKIVLKCLSIENECEIKCKILHGGSLSDNKGINLPSTKLSIPSLTKKDIDDLRFGASLGVDAVALSFVRSPEDIRHLRQELESVNSKSMIVAKIEKQQAIDNLDKILEESDGVMVARGDLGVEVPLQKVPIIQKKIINESTKRGKFVIVATQMLESMIENPSPTRAEASDVANATLDGTDILMLSAETASGKYPLKSVETMDKIIKHVENSSIAKYWRTEEKLYTNLGQRFQNATSLAGVRAAEELKASSIAICTTSGATASLVSDYKPAIPIIAFVPDQLVQRKLCFIWGVQSEIIEQPRNIEDLINKVNNKLIKDKILKKDETVVLLTKLPLVSSQRTNTIHTYSI